MSIICQLRLTKYVPLQNHPVLLVFIDFLISSKIIRDVHEICTYRERYQFDFD